MADLEQILRERQDLLRGRPESLWERLADWAAGVAWGPYLIGWCVGVGIAAQAEIVIRVIAVIWNR